MTSNNNNLVSIREAAAIAGMSYHTFIYWVKTDRTPHQYRIAEHVFFDAGEMYNWRPEHKKRGRKGKA